ncbi:transmembrane protein, putative [Medicago truncatula]|uniref:Transmembrane protein, putative n=1 Tax=Medicago truncatula TaxID=3880 RepID=A0A072UYR1_MEDTR|nr:transmembrane protein, putative [Medicago truncatula]
MSFHYVPAYVFFGYGSSAAAGRAAVVILPIRWNLFDSNDDDDGDDDDDDDSDGGLEKMRR